jgi:hypothetical protein
MSSFCCGPPSQTIRLQMEQLQNRRIKNASNKPTGNKDRGPPTNLAVNSNKYLYSHIFHPGRLEQKNAKDTDHQIPSSKFKNKRLLIDPIIHFCLSFLILLRGPVPLKHSCCMPIREVGSYFCILEDP